jgi:hypothetical protein
MLCLVVCPACVPERMGINKKYPHKKKDLTIYILAKACYIKNEKAQMKKLCKLVRGIKAKMYNTRPWCTGLLS